MSSASGNNVTSGNSNTPLPTTTSFEFKPYGSVTNPFVFGKAQNNTATEFFNKRRQVSEETNTSVTHRLVKPTSDSSLKKASGAVENILDASHAVAEIGEKFPVIGQIFAIFNQVYKMAKQTKINKENCKKAANRCQVYESLVLECANAYTNNGVDVLDRAQKKGLRGLLGSVEDLRDLLEKYLKLGKYSRMVKYFLHSTSFKEEYEEIDREIEQHLAIVSVHLSKEAIEQNNKLLERSKTIMIVDEKLNDFLSNQESMNTKIGKMEASQDLTQTNIRIVKDESKRTNKKLDSLKHDHDEAMGILKGRSMQEKARDRIKAAIMENDIDPTFIDILHEDLIGTGSFGNVYRAKIGGEIVAAKVIVLTGISIAAQQNLFKSFQKEFALMCSANTCQRVIHVYGAVTKDPGKLTLVMEYAANGSLRKYLDNVEGSSGIVKEMACNIIFDIAYGMYELYNKGVHHRDLKSANVLLDHNMIAKVSDFGLSKADALMTSISSKKTVVGTIAWQSPEELDDSDELNDEKCDVYSFAITVWEILTCKIPWYGLRHSQVAIKVLTKGKRPEYDKLSLSKRYGDACIELMESCWKHDCDERPSFSKIVEKIKLFQRDGNKIFVSSKINDSVNIKLMEAIFEEYEIKLMMLEEKLRKSFLEKEEVQRRKSLNRYKLNQKYRYQYPYATPFIVACEKGNADDVQAFVENHDDSLYIGETVNQIGSRSVQQKPSNTISVPFCGGIGDPHNGMVHQRLGLGFPSHPKETIFDVCYRPCSNRDVDPQGKRIQQQTFWFSHNNKLLAKIPLNVPIRLTGLMAAIIFGQVTVVDYLLRQPSIDLSVGNTAKMKNGHNVIIHSVMFLTEKTDINILSMLLNHPKCSVNIVNSSIPVQKGTTSGRKKGEYTALDCAYDQCVHNIPNNLHQSVINLLRKAGAKRYHEMNYGMNFGILQRHEQIVLN